MSAELIDVTRHGADRVAGVLRQRHGLVVDRTAVDGLAARLAAEASVLATSAGELYSDLIFFEGPSRISAVSSGRLVVSCIIGGEAEVVGLRPEPAVLSAGDVIAWPIGHDVEMHARDVEQHTISLPMRSLRVAGYRGDRVSPRLLARPAGPMLTDLWWRHAQFVDQELNREDFFADPRVVGALEQLLAAVALRVFAAVEPPGPAWSRSG